MNYQETINKIKALFEMAAPDASATSAMPMSPDVSSLTDYILQDGTKISCDKMAIGGSVTINGTPAPDGEHQLQDGTMIETKDGLILEITTPAEEATDENVNSDMGKKMEDIVAKMTSHEAMFTSYESRFKSNEDLINKQQSAITMLMQMVEKLATMPVDQPATSSTNQFTSQKNEDKEERFQSVVDAINRIKSN